MRPEEHIGGPVSPELVLIDPELAASARAALPEHPWPAPVRVEPRRPRRRVPVPGIVWTLMPALVLIPLVFGLTLVSTGDRPTFANGGEPGTTTARPTAPPRFTPARTFSWPPSASAAYYQVIFLRNDTPFYRTRVRTALIRLPERVRFTTGVYRWSVRPAIATELGIRLGPPIVDSTFQVSGQ